MSKIVCDKSPFFVIILFYAPYSIFLNRAALDRAALYWNVALSIVVLSTKK